MHASNHGSLNVVPANIQTVREIDCSDASSMFEIELLGQKCAIKLFHDTGIQDLPKKVEA
ncbi:hypothetical protein BDW66DRAFT_149976 [Aspergillus desertorum]